MSVSLKEKNTWRLWLVVTANALVFQVAVQADALRIDGLTALFTKASNVLPLGLAMGLAVLLNGLLTAKGKETLVYLSWHNALPGHRAFSVHAKSDSRIDFNRLERVLGEPLPTAEVDQNHLWFRLYKSVGDAPEVLQVHRSYLLARDWTGFAALLLATLGPAGFFFIPSKRTALLYVVLLVLQCLLAMRAARTYGVRFVTTVLACISSRDLPRDEPRLILPGGR